MTYAHVCAEIQGLELELESLGYALEWVRNKIADQDPDVCDMDDRDSRLATIAERKGIRARMAARTRDLRALRRMRRSMRDGPVGCDEIAAILGYPRNTVHQWRKRGVLPEPTGMISGVPFWWCADVLAWAERTNRAARVTDEVAA